MILEGFKLPVSGPFPPILTFFNIQCPIFAYCGTIVVTAWFSLCYIVSPVYFCLLICRMQRGPLIPHFLPLKAFLSHFNTKVILLYSYASILAYSAL